MDETQLALLTGLPLFENIQPQDIRAVLDCVHARKVPVARGEFISLAGDALRGIGVVFSGQVHVIKEDAFGNRSILAKLGPGDIFGESFICGEVYTLSVSIQAAENAEILFLDFDKVMQQCSNACAFHSTLVRNMVRLIAQKNIRLMEKLDITTKHSLREKVLAYLSQLSQQQRSTRVTSPLGRVELADFLGADRSALTRELSRMQQDGLIRYHKNDFEILCL